MQPNFVNTACLLAWALWYKAVGKLMCCHTVV
jgi:hypothetical protein